MVLGGQVVFHVGAVRSLVVYARPYVKPEPWLHLWSRCRMIGSGTTCYSIATAVSTAINGIDGWVLIDATLDNRTLFGNVNVSSIEHYLHSSLFRAFLRQGKTGEIRSVTRGVTRTQA